MEIRKITFWEILESDQSFVTVEFLKQFSIQTFWKQRIPLESKKSHKKCLPIFWNQASPLKHKELVEINCAGTCLNETHPSKPRNSKKKRFGEILEPDQSAVICAFLKEIIIQMFWK